MPYDISQLLSYSQGVMLDWATNNPLAKWFIPEVPVMTEKFFYKNYGLGNVLTTIDTRRSMGGSPARLSLSVTDASAVLLENALETTIDDIERRQNPETMSTLERIKVGDLTRTVMTNYLKKVFTFMYNAVSVTGTYGVWSSASVDPIQEIDALCQAMIDATGVTPNKLYLDLKAWIAMKNNPKVLGRIQYVKMANATVADVQGLFAVPGLQIKIGGGALFSGATVNNVFLFYAADAPSVMDPSWAKCFVRVPERFTGLRQYRQEEIRSDVYALDWQELLLLTASSMAVRIQTS